MAVYGNGIFSCVDLIVFLGKVCTGLMLMVHAVSRHLQPILAFRMAADDWENPHPCDDDPEELETIWNMQNCIWLTVGSIMQQGCDILPK